MTLDATSPHWTEEDVELGSLHGTLTLPAGSAAATSLMLTIAGSGPVDRDGNLPGAQSDCLKLLARALAGQAIGSLRVDKRGVGASRAACSSEEGMRIGTYVDDALAWLDFLRTRHRGSDVFLLGHSEGALVATLAAQRTGAVSRLILLAGACEPAASVIERQLAEAGVSVRLQSESRRISDSLARGVPVDDVPAELAALYRPSVQNYLMSWLPLDPTNELTKVRVPVLIVQGTTDLQIPIADARRLAGACPHSTLHIVEGMNHVLKPVDLDRARNLASYNSPQMPISPRLSPAIVAFARDLLN